MSVCPDTKMTERYKSTEDLTLGAPETTFPTAFLHAINSSIKL